jgi:hypothetical protein
MRLASMPLTTSIGTRFARAAFTAAPPDRRTCFSVPRSYNLPVRYEWNEAKRRSNLAKHGVDFAEMAAFQWASALVRADTRHDYGEVRLAATGTLGGDRLYHVTFTIRRKGIRIVSLRKASNREIRQYDEET